MARGTWLYSLRGGKFYVLATVIISLSLSFVLFQPQPAHAEDFLTKTVRCVLGVLLGPDCQAATPPASSPQTTAQTASGQPSAQPKATGSTQPSANASAQTQSSKSGQAANGAVAAEMPSVKADLATTPAMPDSPYTYPASSQVLPSFAAMSGFYGTKNSASTDWSALQPSREGWKIFGIAWYWWLMAAAMVTIAVVVKKKAV